ncbi:ricin-type beta-trefoil lectin domain protein [Streptomyces sp. NPDC048352]|uniref:ricin-type beta-trefoil lectin domain protein n=1 Tax=Streptomyces sp. NPDC048352 TaxID=3154718 RepID=UPI003442DBBA
MRRARLAGHAGITISVALVASLLPAQAWAASPGDRSGVQLPGLQQDMKAKLDQVEATKLEGWAGAPVQPPPEYEPSKVTPPAGGTVSVALSGDQLVQAGTLPVSIGKASPTEANPTPPAPSGTWSVAVETRAATEAASVDGALIKVTPPAEGSTPVDVQLDYKTFKDLYGTEWATRLELKQLPACFLTTPDLPECTVTQDVPSTNDAAAGTVRATIDPATAPSEGMRTMTGGGGPVVLAASDGASGAGGMYTATSLSPSGSWTAGSSSGGFSWSYPLNLPAAPAGPAPSVAFSYSSQAVDGKTSVANGQASWIGDGWDYEPGYIERRYRPCADDLKATPSKPNNDNSADKKKRDLCWAGDSVTMSLGGGATELVHDTATGQWIPVSDNGSKVEHKTDASVPNGAKDGEYWVVTTRDGTRYFFGRHDLDGSGTRPVTNSVFTVPVFGNHPGEPCYQTAFASSSCEQAWRWNLDYVEDVHGNAMIIDWAKETNRYAKNEKYKAKVAYIRGGYPTQITYGLRSDSLAGPPGAKVEFTVAERCIKEGTTECSDAEFEGNNYGDKQPWWDTPSTLHCKADAKDCYIASPTFWTRKRLTAVTTYGQRTEGSTALSLVDRWNLAQSFPKQRTDTHPPLWLESITRTGYGTTKDAAGNQESTSLPPVSFIANVKDMPNRVATGSNDATPDFDRLRVETIRSETGSETYVDYSDPCPVGTTHPKPEENTGRCFPVHWSPDPDLDKPKLEWFNKYVVDKVIEKDRVARQPDVATSYTYEGDAAWAKDTDDFSKPELRTYSQWRGYPSVVTKRGVTANAAKSDATEESQSRHRYFRGMSGDAGRPKVTIKDSTGTEDLGEDLPQYQGLTAETITYSKAGGQVVSREVTWPWSQKTAARPRDGTTPLEAFRGGTARTDEVQAISGGKSRMIRTLNTYDPTYGLPVTAQTDALSHNGTAWSTVEQSCTTTTYVHNPAKNLIGLPQRVRKTTGDCAHASTGTALKDARTSYDALNAFGAAPTKGLAVQLETLDAAGTGWAPSGRVEYDALGRRVKDYDAAGNITSSSYSPAAGVAFTVTNTNALGHTGSTKIDPARGNPLEVTDANGRKITTSYDNLGRTTAVWTASQKTSDKPAKTAEYQISEHEAPAVTSRTLQDDGTYSTSVAIYDGLMRTRQTQSEALGSGRLITDTFYNANGSVRQTNNGYYAEGDPGKNIFVPESVFQIPNSTKIAYDGLGRTIRATSLHAGVEQSSATTEYGGDWTRSRTGMSPDGSTPLKGSRASETWTDTLNRTTEVRNYTSTDLTTSNKTSYSYDERGNLAKVTDPAGNSWTYGYDARDRMTWSDDPDAGKTTVSYNNLNQKISTTDSTGRTQFTTYDPLGRATELHDDAANGPLVTSWTFDSLPGAKGLAVSSTHYESGAAYTSEVTGYDTEYRPTGSKITIPDVPGTKGLAGTYVYSTTYTPTGKVQSTTVPATPGGLAAEKLATRYDRDGMPQSMSGLTWYTADVKYSPYGEVLRTATGNAPNRVWTTNQYNPNTGQLTNQISDRETGPNRISDVSYTYDPTGNITSVTDTQPGGREDRQCYVYDPMGQLTKAWTGKTAACAGPSLADVTLGPDGDGFWQEYQFDAIGNRTKLIKRDLTNSALDDETTYTYGVTIAGNGTQPPLKIKPHALEKAEKTTRSPGSTANSVSNYAYDALGNTTSRRIDGDTQTLNWDRRGKVTSATSPGIGAVSVIGASGKCIDVESGKTADGTPVQIYPCNETKAQQWRLTGNTVRALDKCLTASGAKLVLVACDGSDKQKFVYRASDKSLYNPATSQCVDVPNNAADGGDLQLWSCNATGPQQFTFDNTTTYIYDAGGNRLIEETGSSRTLYLGEAEITVNKAGQALDAIRYYSGPGATTVRQTGGKANNHQLSVQLADHHNTANTTIDQSSGQTVTRRKSDPYGNPRGGQPGNWPGSHGFLGSGIDDTNTALTHIGAREYESTTGRFISVDPIIDITDPLQMNGYTYASGNPIGNWDPSGLRTEECGTLYDCHGHTVITASNSHEITYAPISSQRRYYETHAPAPDYRGNNGNGDNWSPRNITKQIYKNQNVKFIDANAIKKKIAFVVAGLGRGVPQAATLVMAPAAKMVLPLVGIPTPEQAYDRLMEYFGVDTKGDSYQAGSLLAPMPGGGAAKSATKLAEKGSGKLAGSIRSALSRCDSFPAGTKVLLANGTSKSIEDVRNGDEVVATEPETGKTEAKSVTGTVHTEDDKSYVDIEIDTGSSSGIITTTTHHVVWSETHHRWLEAGTLRQGDTLRKDDGAPVLVKRIRPYSATQNTYNLTVADHHTYYVLAGATSILVHNCNNPATHEVNNLVDKLDDDVYFHYTSADGHAGILSGDGSLRIGANSAGKVHVTQEIGSSVEIERNVMINNPSHAGKADFLFAFRMPQGVELGPGSQPNELIARGSLKIPAGNVLFHGRNPF